MPLGEILDVPFAFGGKMLQLPAEGKSGVDVFIEKGMDEAREGTVCRWVIEQGMRGGTGKNGGLEDLAPLGVARDSGLRSNFVSNDRDLCHGCLALPFLVLGQMLDISIRSHAVFRRR